MKNITRRSILSLLGLAPLVGLAACGKDEEPPTPLDGLMKEGGYPLYGRSPAMAALDEQRELERYVDDLDEIADRWQAVAHYVLPRGRIT